MNFSEHYWIDSLLHTIARTYYWLSYEVSGKEDGNPGM